jgi:hypothetical protein
MNDTTDPLLSLTNDALEEVMAAVHLWCLRHGITMSTDRGKQALRFAAERRAALHLTSAQLLKMLTQELD